MLIKLNNVLIYHDDRYNHHDMAHYREA